MVQDPSIRNAVSLDQLFKSSLPISTSTGKMCEKLNGKDLRWKSTSSPRGIEGVKFPDFLGEGKPWIALSSEEK